MKLPSPPLTGPLSWPLPLLVAWRFVVWRQPPPLHSRRAWPRDEVGGLIQGILMVEEALAALVALGIWSTRLGFAAHFVGLAVVMAPVGSMITFHIWLRRQRTTPFEWRLQPPAACVRLSLIGWLVAAMLAAGGLLLGV